MTMLSMQTIGYVRSPYADTAAIPKGLGAKHEAEGVLEILAEFELGLTDIEGFSHLFVICIRSVRRIQLAWHTAERQSATRCVRYSLTASSESDWVDGRRVATPGGNRSPRPRHRHARRDSDSRHQTLSLQRSAGAATPWVARGSRSAAAIDYCGNALGC
jgi:hypothetical protein